MNWPYLSLRDVGVILLLLALLGLLLFVSVVGAGVSRKTNYGFGPEWDCSNPGRGALSCIKRLTAPANSY